MGLANWLTVLRILLIPVFVSLLVYRQRGPALAVFLVAAITDLLDGYVARQRGSQSRLGAFRMLLKRGVKMRDVEIGIEYDLFDRKIAG